MTGETQPAAKGVTPEMVEAWKGAYAAFHGAFDTPLARRRQNDDYAADARIRLREFDELLTAALSPPAPGEGGRPVWHVDTWGDGSTPAGMANIFCDAHEATIAAGIPEDIAKAIVESHNAALSAPSSGGLAVKVKPLEWQDGINESHATQPFGAWYFVHQKGSEWRIHHSDSKGHPTRDAAKDAAQANYESRILSALDRTTLPAAEGEKA